ncbi:MAG: hypothetical protein RLZZ184_2086 [Cyanobacteriota bacterium]|jgi:hypothetical protein
MNVLGFAVALPNLQLSLIKLDYTIVISQE